jgi:hypothetical protein
METERASASLEERQDRASFQLAADDRLAAGINPMNLENRLGDV